MAKPSAEGTSAEAALTTILIVEPDILVRMVIADYLRECGYRVIEGVNADDVLAVLGAGTKIDVILTEVQLSGSLDGFGLARQIREDHPEIDVILTSARQYKIPGVTPFMSGALPRFNWPWKAAL